MTHERRVEVPVDLAPAPCPRCGSPARLFTPNARRDPYRPEAAYEPAWQCTQCGELEFVAPPERETGKGSGVSSS